MLAMEAGQGGPPAAPQAESWNARWHLLIVLVVALTFVFLTRVPVLRHEPIDPDEIGFLQVNQIQWFPSQHTLFMAAGRLLGSLVGDGYRGYLLLDMVVSALALTSVWWWLRALVRPGTATVATLLLGVAPTFWAYGAMAGNYTAIPLVGSFLLGVAVRTWREPKRWHPYAATVVLALGAGYRQDIGLFWLPVYLLILWRHRWATAFQAAGLFAVLNLAWLVPMIHEVGGWQRYRATSRVYAHEVIWLNSIGHLGFRDATLRYVVKMVMALLWTFGPALILVPFGVNRLVRNERGRLLAALLAVSVLPALAYHLLLAFGVPGYAFHYVPALVALLAIGAGGAFAVPPVLRDRAPARLSAMAAGMAALFLLYPTNYDRPGAWGDFEVRFCRCTRIGLQAPMPYRPLSVWRTANTRAPHPMTWADSKPVSPASPGSADTAFPTKGIAPIDSGRSPAGN